MTPAARHQAAIEVLDAILAGSAPEPALSNWARAHRFAGSGDRAAIRDVVFDALRCKRSAAARGGAMSGRGLVLGLLRLAERDPATVFSGLGHAPLPLAPDEADAAQPADAWPEAVALDHPDWMTPLLLDSLGEDYPAVMRAFRKRAKLFLRVNRRKATLAEATLALAADGIETRPVEIAPDGLEVVANPRRVAQSAAYRDGLVEVQDAASQAAVAALDLPEGGRILDYCAGGGGKSLAMASLIRAAFFAHDINAARLSDLPARSARAGVEVTVLSSDKVGAGGLFDLVLCDVPCSGSGTWRRNPQAKWDLDAARLADLCALQGRILDQAAALVGPGGQLAYVTCSVFGGENSRQIAAFLDRHAAYTLAHEQCFSPLLGADGMYVAAMRHNL